MKYRGRSARRVNRRALADAFDVWPMVRAVIDVEQWYVAELAAKDRDEQIRRLMQRKRLMK